MLARNTHILTDGTHPSPPAPSAVAVQFNQMLGISRPLRRGKSLSGGDWAQIYAMAGMRGSGDAKQNNQEIQNAMRQRSAALQAAWRDRRAAKSPEAPS